MLFLRNLTSRSASAPYAERCSAHARNGSTKAFSFGLNSLSAASLAWSLEKEFHVDFRLSEILANPTLENLLRLIDAGDRNQPGRSHVKVLPDPKSIPLSFPRSRSGFSRSCTPNLTATVSRRS
jgi:hypothetical protein